MCVDGRWPLSIEAQESTGSVPLTISPHGVDARDFRADKLCWANEIPPKTWNRAECYISTRSPFFPSDSIPRIFEDISHFIYFATDFIRQRKVFRPSCFISLPDQVLNLLIDV
jgi:hypothetical protein